MASPFDQTSSKNSEKVQQVEEPSQTKLTPNLPRVPVKKRVVGFDCEFVEQPPKAFQVDCPVCLLVLREPHQLTCCGYSFCQPCVDRVEKGKNPCPTCNKTEFSVFPNKGLQRSLYGFHVRCSHEKEGCQWTDELGELEKHLNESPIPGQRFIGCDFTEIECSECSESFQRQHFKAHQLEQHTFNCEYCHDYESYFEDVVENHYPNCGFRPVPCPNECGVHPKHQNIEHHLSEDCPLTVVNCDFRYAGCEVQLVRQDMPAHLAENLVPHMAQLATYNQKKVQEKDQQIMQLSEGLKEKLEENSQKISQLSKSLIEKKEEIAQLKEYITKEVAQLKQKQESAMLLRENSLKHEVAQLRQDKHRQDAATQQELVKLQRLQKDAVSRQENEILKLEVAKLKQDNHKQDAAIKQEIATLRRMQKNAVPREEMKREVAKLKQDKHRQDAATKQEIVKLQRMQKIISREENEALEEKITHLQEDVHTNESENKAMRKEIAQMKVELDQVQLYHAAAHCVELTMREVTRHWRNGDEWYSDPFYTHPCGYKMCLRVDANGWGDGKGTHISIFVHMMRGEHDDDLEWPFRGEVTVQLLNQLQGEDHCSFTVCFHTFANSATFICGQRVTTDERALDGVGKSRFLPHSELDHDPARKHQFIQDDCLRFRVTRITNVDIDQLIPVAELPAPCIPVSPVEFSMADFEQQKVKCAFWYSPPFYTHQKGYKMCLNVDANGYGRGKGTHVSAFIFLMRGENDDFLEWPFRGNITIQLLNQIEDKEHHEITLDFPEDTDITGRLTTKERTSSGLGNQLISHCKLNYDLTRNCQYLKYDSLSFRIKLET